MTVDKTGLVSEVFDALSDSEKNQYIMMYNLDTGYSRWSNNAVEYFGLPGEYVYRVEKKWFSLIHPDDYEYVKSELMSLGDSDSAQHCVEYRIRNKIDNYVRCSCYVHVYCNKETGHRILIATMTNHGIADNIDHTTGLFNVYEFLSVAGKRQSQRMPCTLLILGLANLGDINGIKGFAYGDGVLRAFASNLEAIVSGCGSVYRAEGTKFYVGLRSVDIQFINDIFAKIQSAARSKIRVSGRIVPLLVAGGAVIIDDFAGDIHTVIACASNAMNVSKHLRHGALVIAGYGDALNDAAKNLVVVDRVRRSIIGGFRGFYLDYQPFYDAKSETVSGMEALLRYKDDEFGIVPPGSFIPQIELDPAFFDLGNFILRRVLTETLELVRKYPYLQINVNISDAQLERPEFRDSLVGILEDTHFPRHNLCLELTERCRTFDFSYLKQEVEFIQSLGVKVAVDDFGTGVSSLNLFQHINVDVIKIDRSFVQSLDNRNTLAMTESIISCLEKLGVGVCLEGIENEKMRSAARKLKANTLQGFYYSRPISLESVEKLIEKRKEK